MGTSTLKINAVINSKPSELPLDPDLPKPLPPLEMGGIPAKLSPSLQKNYAVRLAVGSCDMPHFRTGAPYYGDDEDAGPDLDGTVDAAENLDSSPGEDAHSPDAVVQPDGGNQDAGVSDASQDARTNDGALLDAHVFDAAHDGALVDAAPQDAAPADAQTDSAPVDAASDMGVACAEAPLISVSWTDLLGHAQWVDSDGITRDAYNATITPFDPSVVNIVVNDPNAIFEIYSNLGDEPTCFSGFDGVSYCLENQDPYQGENGQFDFAALPASQTKKYAFVTWGCEDDRVNHRWAKAQIVYLFVTRLE